MSNLEPGAAKICIVPRLQGLGGPASFSGRLIAGLQARGYRVSGDPLDPEVKVILVMGGTRRLDLLWRARRRGVRIVQRLNGMNWVHRKLPTGWRHYLKAEASNWTLSTTRRYLADRIIYQSRFTQDWWQTVFGPVRAPGQVIYNGVDLNVFSPNGGPERPPQDRIRMVMLEARLGGGMEPGLENAVGLLQQLNATGQQSWELQVAGDVPAEMQSRWLARAGQGLSFCGVVARQQVPALDRAAHMLFSADLNAACPNSVVEALACGLPVIAFATGALPEMVTGDAGRVVPYGSNFWNIEPPVLAPMLDAAREVAANQETFRRAARQRAEEAFNLDRVVDAYLSVMLQ